MFSGGKQIEHWHDMGQALSGVFSCSSVHCQSVFETFHTLVSRNVISCSHVFKIIILTELSKIFLF